MSENSQELEGKIIFLSFEEFSKNSKNFYLYFISNEAGKEYRNTPQYQSFAKKNPELAQKLLKTFSDINIFYKRGKRQRESIALMPYINDLYEEYKIMREEGFSDEILY